MAQTLRTQTQLILQILPVHSGNIVTLIQFRTTLLLRKVPILHDKTKLCCISSAQSLKRFWKPPEKVLGCFGEAAMAG